MNEKVTTEVLRDMEIGETRVFHVGDSASIYSAQALAYRAQNLFGCKFVTEADHKNSVITISKTER